MITDMTSIGAWCIVPMCEEDNIGDHNGEVCGMFAARSLWPVLQVESSKHQYIDGWEPVCKEHYDQYLKYLTIREEAQPCP